MYEFLDAHGERVTIRSVRTLVGLLQRGAITAATPFRRAEDAAFGPAGKHPELRAIAAEFGVALDGTAGAAPRQAPAPPAATPLARPPAATPPARPPAATPPARPPAATPPARPPARTPRASVPAMPPRVVSPRVVSPTPAVAVRTAPILAARGSPWSRFAPPARPRRRPANSLVGSTGIVLLNLASAAVLGTVARFVVADASHSRIGAMLSMVAVTALAGHYAGRVLAGRVPRPTGWAVSLAAAIFALGCYEVAQTAGLVVAAATAVPLWQRLSQPRQSP